MNPIPKVREDDPEDVSWALSTAATQLARGDRAEALKWLRRAAEAASEADDDKRALEIAKAAADLSVARDATPRRGSDLSVARDATPRRGSDLSVARDVTPRRGSDLSVARDATPRRGSDLSVARDVSPPKGPDPSASRSASPPKAAAKVTPRPQASSPKRAKGSGPGDTGKRAALKSSPNLKPSKPTVEAPRPPPDPEVSTDVHSMAELTKHEARPPGARTSAAEADAWPTESMDKSYLDSLIADPARGAEIYGQERALGALAYNPETASAASDEPSFRASQAVAVVVWRAADGTLRLAPKGAAVSAVTIDALLVAPDPDVDLLAWLTPT